MSSFETHVAERFGPEATAEAAYDLLTVDVPATGWLDALRTARDELGCTYFDWLSAVDEPGTGFRVCAHVAALGAPGQEDHSVRRLLLRTTVPHEAPALPTAVGVYAGAAWHERETHEMFGVSFTDHPHLVPLLLPENFEGHPLRKDFVLAARVAKAWPGAKEPGESDHGGPKRRQMLPPGVPDPNEWGPLKGQLPPAPARPTRTPRAAGAAGERPARRTRSVTEGSASQTAPEAAEAPSTAPARRARTAAEGSASQQPSAATPRRAHTASEGSATQRAEDTPPSTSPRPRSTDAPWHHARPAFDDTTPEAETKGAPAPGESVPASEAEASPAPAPEAATTPAPVSEAETKGAPAPAEPAPVSDAGASPARGSEAGDAPAAVPSPEAEATAEPDGDGPSGPGAEADRNPGAPESPPSRTANGSAEGTGAARADSEGDDPA
ncbi:NADH-quinone oxidoreductase subunit C [Streptomyces sp. NPDC127084]|uniref:NADH-quinone oxidoreductase subunit C n=1 Tax=Streptomyces sp. NPDC127084 TaxID=3347133 RepID=UPI0036461B80